MVAASATAALPPLGTTARAEVEAVERAVAAEGASVVLARRTVEVVGYWGCWRHP